MRIVSQSLGNIIVPIMSHEAVLPVYPISARGGVVLPVEFSQFEDAVNELLSKVPYQEGVDTHFVTIHNGMIGLDEPLRREGLHIDGNYCADVEFSYGNKYRRDNDTETRCCWAGSLPVLNPKDFQGLFTIESPFTPQLDVPIEFGTYVSGRLGGLICSSSTDNCIAHKTGDANFNVDDGGRLYEDEFDAKSFDRLPANSINFMTSNTPHQSTGGTPGMRSLIRITLHHSYKNDVITASH
jgi:hypothetical protein